MPFGYLCPLGTGPIRHCPRHGHIAAGRRASGTGRRWRGLNWEPGAAGAA
jgi:hypothetical protein